MDRDEVIENGDPGLRPWPRGMIGFFDGGILALYRDQSDKYELKTDYFEGSVVIRSDYYNGLTEPECKSTRMNVRFGFRSRTNGELAVAAWLPDLFETSSESERNKWLGFHLRGEVFPKAPDPRFDLWIRRYVYGDWEVENGVLFQISDEVANINAITEVTIGERLYEFHENPAMIFPTAENDRLYQDAHKEAYGYLIDGLRKSAIESLGVRLGLTVQVANDKTLVGLKKILLPKLHKSILDPFEVVSQQRRLASHQVRPQAKAFAAFEQFSKDMDGVLGGLRALKLFLEGEFKMTAEKCRLRQSRMASLPKIDDAQKPEPRYSISQLSEVEGKTIKKVEFGFRKPTSECHESEAMILYFSDGSILGIETGSNAWNLSSNHEGLQAKDFHVDFILTVVPPAA